MSSDDRRAFAERIRLQLRSRYTGVELDTDHERFALRLTAPGLETSLPLAPLYHRCVRDPSSSGAAVARFVAAVERQLAGVPRRTLGLSRLLWCVRSRSYLDSLSRSDELLVTELSDHLVGFVAETLPGSIMRGRPRSDWLDEGLGDERVAAAATANTAARFAPLAGRIRAAERVPTGGWSLTGDALFQGSLLVAPDVLAALRERSGGEVLLATPDRGLVLALPAGVPAASRFRQRVTAAYREAMNPCSADVLTTDGEELRPVSPGSPAPPGRLGR